MSSRTPGKVCRETPLSREGNIASVIHRPYQMLSSTLHTVPERTLFPYTPFYFPYKEIKCSLVNCPHLAPFTSLDSTRLIHKPPSKERKGVDEGSENGKLSVLEIMDK